MGENISGAIDLAAVMIIYWKKGLQYIAAFNVHITVELNFEIKIHGL